MDFFNIPFYFIWSFFFFFSNLSHREEDSLCPRSPSSPPRLPFYPNLNLALSPPLDIRAAASNVDFRRRRQASGISRRDQNFCTNPSCLGSNKFWGNWRRQLKEPNIKDPKFDCLSHLKFLEAVNSVPWKGRETDLKSSSRVSTCVLRW